MQKVFLLVAALAFLTATPLVGQPFLHTNVESPKRFSFVLHAGLGIGGPASSLAVQMNDAGLGDPDPRRCSYSNCRPPESPEENALLWAVGLDARYAVMSSMSVGLGLETAGLGGAKGFRLSDRSQLESSWTATILSAGAFWYPIEAIYVGGGPALYHLTNTAGEQKVSQVGLAGELGVTFPPQGRGFIDLSAKGHFVPETDVVHAITNPGDQHVIAPSTFSFRPDWRYVRFSLGFGIRLF